LGATLPVDDHRALPVLRVPHTSRHPSRHDASGRGGETVPLLKPPSAVAGTVYRVLVLGSKDSESAGVQPEVLVPEALGRVDGEMDARYVDMGMENGTIFQCEELEWVSSNYEQSPARNLSDRRKAPLHLTGSSWPQRGRWVEGKESPSSGNEIKELTLLLVPCRCIYKLLYA
jgi:hypothetical protein